MNEHKTLDAAESYARFWREVVPVTSWKRRCLVAARELAILAGTPFVKRPEKGSVTCIYCHYVFDDQREQFQHLLNFLGNIGKFITADEVVEVALGHRRLSGAAFHLSFDDGFKNVITNGLPILRELDIPSTFFVTTQRIGATYEKARELCQQSCDYPATIEMATWEDLRMASRNRMEIGSHTRTHVRFAEISDKPHMLEDEIIGSKQDIETELGVPCKYISWPFGTRMDADAVSLEAVRKAGYRACFSAMRGRVSWGSSRVHELPRHHFEPQWPLFHIRYFVVGNGASRRT